MVAVISYSLLDASLMTVRQNTPWTIWPIACLPVNGELEDVQQHPDSAMQLLT